ncbi:MAG: 23S rRNA (uracil(1939)-C(5))-methyltransferase RlmD [Cyanobacteria bacterium P01_D01_bin.105]
MSAPIDSPSVWPAEAPEPQWQQGETLKIEITDLSNSGDGVGRWKDRVVFVPNTVPGDIMRVKMTKIKPTHGFGIPAGIIKPSPDRVRPACIVADKCGGCQWQPVSYQQQLASKRDLVIDALTRIGKLTVCNQENPSGVQVDDVMPSEEQLGYRNKATYPLGLSQIKAVQAGYYRKGSHRLVNLNQCPVQDNRLDPMLAEIKQDIQAREWKIYNEKFHKGHLKHLSLRIGRRTGQVLLTLISRSVKLKGIHEQAEQWMARYPNLAGVLVNLNWKKTNAIFGPDTYCIAGASYLEEQFAGLTFHIQPSTFFQVNTAQAEKLLTHIQSELTLTGTETLLDAYCGVGTFTLPLANQVRRCIGLEAFMSSVTQAEENAALNNIENVTFKAGDVGELLPELAVKPDIVLMDPPRRGCEPAVLNALIEMKPKRIVYVSCNPATLARDLRELCETGKYQVRRVQPADFFPQTAHVECAAFLVA